MYVERGLILGAFDSVGASSARAARGDWKMVAAAAVVAILLRKDRRLLVVGEKRVMSSPLLGSEEREVWHRRELADGAKALLDATASARDAHRRRVRGVVMVKVWSEWRTGEKDYDFLSEGGGFVEYK